MTPLAILLTNAFISVAFLVGIALGAFWQRDKHRARPVVLPLAWLRRKPLLKGDRVVRL